MSLKNFFFPSILLFLLLMPSASAIPVRFSDLNFIGRDISIYQVNESGSHLVFSGKSDNATFDFNPDFSYQIVSEPSRASWLDDPFSLLRYFIDDGAGQIITFVVALFFFGGCIKLALR